jgi:hypothetical protein
MRVGKPSLGLLLGCLWLAVPTTGASAVSVDHDGSVDFSRYRTFGWKEGTPAGRPSAEKRIVDAVERELEARGFRKVDGDADSYVITHVLVSTHTLEELSDPDYWKFYTGVTSVDPRVIGAGTLVIDLLDGRSETVVWRGLASGSLTEIPERNFRKIDRAVKKLVRRLPGG